MNKTSAGVLVCSLTALLLTAPAIQARYENDLRIMTLDKRAMPGFAYPAGYPGDTSSPPDLEEEVSIYFGQGYHPVSVLFYAMRNGMGANKTIDLAEQAGVSRDYLESAIESVETVLPGNVCGGGYFVKDYQATPGAYSITSLQQDLDQAQGEGGASGPQVQPTLSDIIARFFDNNQVLSTNQDDPEPDHVYYLNWPLASASISPGGVPDTVESFLASGIQAHYFATGDELLALANQDQNADLWYYDDSPLPQGNTNSQSLNNSAPIVIALYPDDSVAVVATGQMTRIRQAAQDGTRLPVLFFFADSNTTPLNRVAPKIGFPELANAYTLYGTRSLPVPSWEDGNYMTLITAQQLDENFELPDRQDIPDERYSQAVQSLANGRPLQIAMVGGKMILGNPDRAVAMVQESGMDFLPVNVSYVELEPDEQNFSVCRYAFPFAGGLSRIGISTGSGVVCEPETRVIEETKRVKVHSSPDRYETVTIKKTITIPCPE